MDKEDQVHLKHSVKIRIKNMISILSPRILKSQAFPGFLVRKSPKRIIATTSAGYFIEKTLQWQIHELYRNCIFTQVNQIMGQTRDIFSNLIFFNALFQNLKKLSIMHQFAFLPFASLVGFAFVVSVSYSSKKLLDFFFKPLPAPQDYDEQRQNEDNIKHVTRDWSFRTTSKNE